MQGFKFRPLAWGGTQADMDRQYQHVRGTQGGMCVRVGGACVWVVLLAGLFGCHGDVTVSDENLTVVDYATFQTWVVQAQKKRVVVVDVRQADAYDAGHIPGAIHLTLPNMRASDPQLVGAKTIVVYGSTWTDSLTPASVKRLLVLGYANVVGFRGGWDQWSRRASEP